MVWANMVKDTRTGMDGRKDEWQDDHERTKNRMDWDGMELGRGGMGTGISILRINQQGVVGIAASLKAGRQGRQTGMRGYL